MLDYEMLGLNIKKSRMHKGLTQKVLAEMVGCDTSHISNIENNFGIIRIRFIFS